MTYQVKIIYPKEEAAENNKLTERTFNEFIDGLELEEVITQYEQLLTKGYSISVNFAPPQLDDKGTEPDPFMIAGRLELAGIPYKATLKLKASGDYESMNSKIMIMISQLNCKFARIHRLILKKKVLGLTKIIPNIPFCPKQVVKILLT